jgi:hypothetical protein
VSPERDAQNTADIHPYRFRSPLRGRGPEAAAHGAGAGLEGRLRVSVPVTFLACASFGSLARFSMLILSTGANKGIGFEVARQLAAPGCTVLVGAWLDHLSLVRIPVWTLLLLGRQVRRRSDHSSWRSSSGIPPH